MSGGAEVVLGGATAANTLPATDFAGSFPVDAFAKAPVGFSVLLQALPLEDPPLFAFAFVDIVSRTKQKTERQCVDESSQKSTHAVARGMVECAISVFILQFFFFFFFFFLDMYYLFFYIIYFITHTSFNIHH